MAVALADGGEDRGHADHHAAVIIERVNRREGGLARCDGCRQNQDVLVMHHRREVVAENHLAAADKLGRDDIYRLVGVHVDEVVQRQLARHAGADDLGAVQADDRVHDRGGSVGGDHLLRNRLCLGKTGFLRGDIHVVVGVAVHGGKVSLLYAEKHIFVFGSDFVFL